MNIGMVGTESDFRERLDGMVEAGTVLVPCSVDEMTGASATALDAIVLGPQLPIRDALEAAQQLDSAHPDLGVVLVAEPHPKVLRAALLAGGPGTSGAPTSTTASSGPAWIGSWQWRPAAATP